jgi:PIN domain nuclease of toxin-antitoxin system
MRLLLDAHILLAVLEKRTETFAPGVRQLTAEPGGEFHVSVASLWEIAIKWGNCGLRPHCTCCRNCWVSWESGSLQSTSTTSWLLSSRNR